jgi:hypothetical protein
MILQYRTKDLFEMTQKQKETLKKELKQALKEIKENEKGTT